MRTWAKWLRNFFMSLILVVGTIFLVQSVYAQQVAYLDSGAGPGLGLTNIGDGFNYFTNSDDTSDVTDARHGSTIAQIIAGEFNGTIIPFVVTDGTQDNPDQVTVARDSALSDILGRADVKVVAITWGRPGVTGSSASLMPQLTDQGKVVAIISGNEFASQPNALATASFNLPGVVIVGGTDADGRILDSVNRAGTTAQKYVTTQGVNSNSQEQGSSFATAKIAGIAGAVLMQNPALTSAEVVEVILASAEDRGDPGVDTVYGHGYIATAAQVLNNPLGQVVIPETNSGGGGGGGGGGGAALLVGGALAGAIYLMKKPSSKLEKTLVLDSYGRGFHLDLNDYISISDGTLHLTEFFHGLQQKSFGQQISTHSGQTDVVFYAASESDPRIDLIEYFGMADDVVLNQDKGKMALHVASRFDNGIGYQLSYQINPSIHYGATDGLDNNVDFGYTSFISGQSFDSVLSSFSSQANSFNIGYDKFHTGKLSLDLGLVSVDQKPRFGLDSLSTILQGKYQFNDNAAMSIQFGQLDENKSLFGGSAGGVFGVKNATTYAVNMLGTIKANDKFSIVANYGIGHTEIDEASTGFLRDFTNLKSDWYGVGVIGNSLFREKDQMGLSFSQPLKVRSGSVNLSVPTARDFSGTILRDVERLNLADTDATEHVFEGYYRTMLTKKMEFGTFFSYRQNPNHITEHGDDALVMATLRYRN